MAEEIFWKCPVCGFEARNGGQQDKHMQETGHLTYDDVEDKGKETSPEPSDLEYTKHTGYTPGVSSGDVHSNTPDLQSRNRILGEKKKNPVK